MSDPTTQSPTAHAMALLQRGLPSQAIAVMRQLIELEPNSAEHRYHLSLIFTAIGQRDDAITSLRGAIRLNPNLAAAHLNLGVSLFGRGDVAAAEQSFRNAIATGQADEGAWRNLGKALRALDRFDDAEHAFRTAISLNPQSADAWMMLGSVLRESGQITEAIAATRQAVELRPDYREAHSNLCYSLYFDPNAKPTEILGEHRAWAAKFTPPVSAPPTRPLHNPIRVGYISPYFRRHVVGAFMEPILAHHDRSLFAITCYSDTKPEDDLTSRIRATATAWRDIAGHSDQDVAASIRQDEIDILVDLTLHMRGCRLGVFGLRPAPIQITHLAYCGTSGLPQMDYFVTDAHMLGPGCEKFFSEKPLPLATSYWCYRPPDVAPTVRPLPMLRNGYVTFGSLNTAAKINEQVVQLWSRLLIEIPKSKLAIHVPGGSQALAATFARYGIGASRLQLIPRQTLNEYFQTWNQIDIALDPFPYNGGTTTLDALWMGVPVVTLAGQLPLGRAGVSILRNLSLDQFIAGDPNAYIAVASSLASDPDRLSSLRQSSRGVMTQSPLLNARQYVAELEAAYRDAVIRRTF
jgi:protein O-GlcNAc transferase